MNSHRPRNNSDEERLSATVLRCVAAYANEKPEDLPSLNETVDPDALDAIFDSRDDGSSRSEGTVTFPYAGFRVTASADGSVSVDPLDSEEE